MRDVTSCAGKLTLWARAAASALCATCLTLDGAVSKVGGNAFVAGSSELAGVW